MCGPSLALSRLEEGGMKKVLSYHCSRRSLLARVSPPSEIKQGCLINLSIFMAQNSLVFPRDFRTRYHPFRMRSSVESQDFCLDPPTFNLLLPFLIITGSSSCSPPLFLVQYIETFLPSLFLSSLLFFSPSLLSVYGVEWYEWLSSPHFSLLPLCWDALGIVPSLGKKFLMAFKGYKYAF